jgi:hypothetical protein
VGETIQVQVDQSQCDIMGNVDLNVIGYCRRGTLQEPTEALITQLHQKDRQVGVRVTTCAQVLYHIGVLGRAEETTFFFKSTQVGDCSGVTQVKERWVHDLSSTEETITPGLTHTSIGPSTKTVFFEQLNIVETKLVVTGSHD